MGWYSKRFGRTKTATTDDKIMKRLAATTVYKTSSSDYSLNWRAGFHLVLLLLSLDNICAFVTQRIGQIEADDDEGWNEMLEMKWNEKLEIFCDIQRKKSVIFADT